ncbi:copper-binding protein [Dyella sp. 20L07]|uniref:copper-binding protein n=1 Tax=Dyella sp. 20L07 TaxID=3384240 RepID=UPI003D283094
MKHHILACALIGTLVAVPSMVAAQTMDPNMPGMQHDAQRADAQGTGIVRAIDTTKNTITLQHEAIASLGWPAMTMAFKVASPDLLKAVKAGDKVTFSLHPAGMNSTVTAIKLQQP